MKNLIFCFVFALVQTTYAAGREIAPDVDTSAKAVQQAQNLFKNIKSTTALWKALNGKLDAKVIEGLKKRLPKKDLAISFEKLTAKAMMVKAGKDQVVLEFLGEVEGSSSRTRFLVNQKEFEFDAFGNLDEQMNALARLMPGKTASLIMQLLIPQVEADDFSGFLQPILMAGIMGITMYSIANIPKPPVYQVYAPPPIYYNPQPMMYQQQQMYYMQPSSMSYLPPQYQYYYPQQQPYFQQPNYGYSPYGMNQYYMGFLPGAFR